MPAVSVVLPTYNRSHLLSRSIQSVLSQAYSDFELIIVDDGSTDDTEKVVKSFKSNKIKYIRHRDNKGLSTSRNTGIRAARGKYIAFQDDDDEWMPEKLEKQIKAFETAPSAVGVVYTGFHRINIKKNYETPARITRREGYIFSSLLRQQFVPPQSAVIKRDCFEKVGMFDESFIVMEDWELFLRMAQYYQFRYINEPLVTMYRQSRGLSTKHGEHINSLQQILKTYSEQIRRDKKTLAKYYYWLGDLSCSCGKLSQGRDYFIQSLRVYPLDARIFVAFLVSLLGENIYNILSTNYRERRILWAKFKGLFYRAGGRFPRQIPTN